MQPNDSHTEANDLIKVSPVVLHSLVEKIAMLQTRLEQLERHNIIRSNQSLADITAAYDISPIPSRLSMANTMGKSDPKSNTMRSDTQSVQLLEAPENEPKEDDIAISTSENDKNIQLRDGISRESLQWAQLIPNPMEAPHEHLAFGSLKHDNSENCVPDISGHTSEANGTLEQEGSEFDTCSSSSHRCQTPSLIMSGSTDTVSTRESPAISQILHKPPRVVTLQYTHDIMFYSEADQLTNATMEFNSSSLVVHNRKSIATSVTGAAHNDNVRSIERKCPGSREKQSYGRCYSSFFPTTLLGSSTFYGNSLRLSLASSLRELSPLFEQSGSCLNLQDHVNKVSNSVNSPAEQKSLTTGTSASYYTQRKGLIGAKNWISRKLTASRQMRSSISASMPGTEKQSLLSQKWSKLRGKM
jgi:hypothetical protein